MLWIRRAVLGVVLAGAAVASVAIVVTVDAGSHSASDTLYGVVGPIGLVWLVALAVSVLAVRTMGRS